VFHEWNFLDTRELVKQHNERQERIMGFGKGALLWLIGIPLPVIILIALFMHH
jgi:hypothetical protein